jgi:ankyrin repeat protein
MYHSHKATLQHDKVYALLGISSDATNETSLAPNYDLPWKDLFGILIKFLLHRDICVEPSPTKEHTSIKGAVYILGFIHSVTSKQATEVTWRNVSGKTADSRLPINVWTLRPSAKPIMKGDIVCLFHGASRPTIIRIHGLHCIIVQIAPTPPTQVKLVEGYMNWSDFVQRAGLLPTQYLHCVWHWGTSLPELEYGRRVEFGLVNGLWNSMLILLQAGMDEAERLFQSLMRAYEMFEEENLRKSIADHLYDISDLDYQRLKWDLTDAPLSWASGEGLMAVVNLLIGNDENAIGLAHRMKYSPLTSAAKNGHLQIVERLLQEKPAIDKLAVLETQSGRPSRTALQTAAEEGHLEIVEKLLEEDADVNSAAAEFCGRTALQAACEGGHIEIVEKLLRVKAHVNASGARDHGRTALQAAAEGGYLTIVERLLQAGAYVNAEAAGMGGTTALQAAVRIGHIAIVERLLNDKADINSVRPPNNDIKRALEVAVLGGHLAVVIRLLQEGANVHEVERHCSRTAGFIIYSGRWEIMEQLIEAQPHVNAVDARDQRPLLIPVDGPRLDIDKQLLQVGPRTNPEDDSSIAALQKAGDKGQAAIIELLRQASALQ